MLDTSHLLALEIPLVKSKTIATILTTNALQILFHILKMPNNLFIVHSGLSIPHSFSCMCQSLSSPTYLSSEVLRHEIERNMVRSEIISVCHTSPGVFHIWLVGIMWLPSKYECGLHSHYQTDPYDVLVCPIFQYTLNVLLYCISAKLILIPTWFMCTNITN